MSKTLPAELNVAELNAHDGANDGAFVASPPLNTLTTGTSINLSAIEFTIHDSLAAVEGDWRAFEQHADCTVFQCYDWQAIWCRHIGARNGTKPAIVVGRSHGDIQFIFPLAVGQSGLMRELVWLGSDLCDYNAPILSKHFSNAFEAQQFCELWARIKRSVMKHPALGYDFVRLEKMPAKVGAQANPMLALGVALNPSGAYVTDLTDSWDAYYASKRSSSTRSRDRAKRRRMAETGELKFVHPENTQDILASVDMLIAQKTRSFARMGVANLFAWPGYTDFYRALMTDPKARHLTHISRLDCGSQALAVNLGLTFRDSYYHLQASHDDGELSRHGPGAAHLHELLRYAIECGFKKYDFTIGDERYKRDWCDQTLNLYDHTAVATWRGAIAYLPLLVKQWLKRQIKQSPLLWKVYSWVRSGRGTALSKDPALRKTSAMAGNSENAE